MKTSKITLVLITFLLSTTFLFSQSVEGKLAIKGLMDGKTIKQNAPVELFKAFKDGVYSINFNFKTSDIKSNQIILFDMKTTVKYNGKIISETSRDGWPWLPGDMFVPIEAFDVIPVLQKFTAIEGTKSLPLKGARSFEIILQLVPSKGQKVKGTIGSTTMKLTL
ncbi:hypothetical protein MWU65_07555 [Cellulophaga sp. F20128]|uniref:hypothetical protein n=1 Tax=Cellulophaga sp. F20128 TaxID=2926413 RepID=UPI001FF44A9B|nr:hypothetical protein [Cellulophaga sp. F20128]MCK0157032.1 hypothetical protein [Cellulophaga sp. F20128]